MIYSDKYLVRSWSRYLKEIGFSHQIIFGIFLETLLLQNLYKVYFKCFALSLYSFTALRLQVHPCWH